MKEKRSIDELTERNVAIIAEMEKQAPRVRTRVERAADNMAQVLGSWWFLVPQRVILLLWVFQNPAAWF
jgi:uncharacterized membrane protein